MNEYTRREETRWILATVIVLLPAVAGAIFVLVTAKGPMVTDPAAIRAEKTAQQVSDKFKPCTKNARDIGGEVGVFKSRAAKAKRAQRDALRKRRRSRRAQKADEGVEIPWSAASPVFKHVAVLDKNDCRSIATQATTPSKRATSDWALISKAAKLTPKSKDKAARTKAAQQLLALVSDTTLGDVGEHAKKARKKLDANLAEAKRKRGEARIQAPLPEGLFSRGAAIGTGVSLVLIALIISYLSVWSASVRRGRTLVALRPLANTEEAGMQAAAIVRLAAHHNGGEPGLAIGAALGGLLGVLIAPAESQTAFIPDLFVGGTMAGLLFGILVQGLVRRLDGASRFRRRAKELGDIEKPTISIDLVMNAVTPGLEKQFLRYFESQPIANGAAIVQKLAAQAEAQILAAADAAAAQQMSADPMHGGPPHAEQPQGQPPGGGSPWG